MVTTVHAQSDLAQAVDATVTALASKPLWSLVETKRLLRSPSDEVVARMALESEAFARGLRGPAFAQAAEAFRNRPKAVV
ncbi:hypothetical protein [Sphingomonas aracearum]|uniref:Enoyl-CoA hydratase n=1 Tax=Sphingomonas aracearum TaxID=2283317 RepID=A0A369VP35_9SPHN|nr:hypothetical protein [Sphingomonas aracearum]RDE04146.1 hypothetical protein DVW87_17595 [Sphingomonas aracearum]